jgi:hypothetical protein
MLGLILLTLIYLNVIAFVGNELGFSFPAIATISQPDLPPILTQMVGESGESGFFDTAIQFIITIVNILVFIINFVLVFFTVPYGILSIEDIPAEIRSILLGPFVFMVAIVGYKLIRRG